MSRIETKGLFCQNQPLKHGKNNGDPWCGVILLDYESSPVFLREGRASKTRARVKITPREKGETRRWERKMRDYWQSPSFWPFTADWFWSVKFVSLFKSIKRIQWGSFSHWAVIAFAPSVNCLGYLSQIKENPDTNFLRGCFSWRIWWCKKGVR